MSKDIVTRKPRLPNNFKTLLEVVANAPLDKNDPESMSYAEALALHTWKQALSDGRNSHQWASLLMDRAFGKVPTEVKVETTVLVETIASKLLSQGMSAEQIKLFLSAAGVEDRLLGAVEEAIDAEIIDG